MLPSYDSITSKLVEKNFKVLIKNDFILAEHNKANSDIMIYFITKDFYIMLDDIWYTQ